MEAEQDQTLPWSPEGARAFNVNRLRCSRDGSPWTRDTRPVHQCRLQLGYLPPTLEPAGSQLSMPTAAHTPRPNSRRRPSWLCVHHRLHPTTLVGASLTLPVSP